MNLLIDFYHQQSWIVQVGIILALILIAVIIEIFFYRRLILKAGAGKYSWYYALIRALHFPLLISLIVLGSLLGLEMMLPYTGYQKAIEYLDKARELLLIISVIWFLIRLVSQLEINLYHQESSRFDRATLYIFSRLLRIGVSFFGFLIILPTLGIPISGLLAFGGAGALVLGLAAKDSLANFFGGLLLFLDRPFKIGETISSSDSSIEGEIEHIGWRLTSIRTVDKQLLYIPNATFSSMAVENSSRRTHRRIKTTIGVRYEDVPVVKSILARIEEMLRSHPHIDQSQTILVRLTELGDFSINFLVYAFTKTTNWVEFLSVQEDVLLKILAIVEEQGAQMPSPTTTMRLEKEIQVELLKND